MYKFRTLKEGSDIYMFAQEKDYTKVGKFLRKTKLDELPALWNVLKGDMGIFGYRPEEKRTWDMMPEDVRAILSPHKPGFIDLASLHFFDEEKLYQNGNADEIYWNKVLPMKMVLRSFYFENECFLLKAALLWLVIKKMYKSLWKD